MILRKYKNELLKIIQESGLEPTLFEARDGLIDKDEYFIITLLNTGICFAITSSTDSFEQFWCRCSSYKADFPLSGITYINSPAGLNNYFRSWIGKVVNPYLDDIATPDLWQALQESYIGTKTESETPDDFQPFSDEEKIRIRLSIQDFRLLIINDFSPNKEQLESIDGRLKYLSDALDKHNRFDWKSIAINTVFTIVIALSLSPEQGSRLLQLFKQVFSGIIYFLSSG